MIDFADYLPTVTVFYECKHIGKLIVSALGFNTHYGNVFGDTSRCSFILNTAISFLRLVIQVIQLLNRDAF